jgi:uncharacterized protein (DUF1778 family)
MQSAARTKRLNIRVTMAEKIAIDRAAKRSGKGLTRFILWACLSPQDAVRLLSEPQPEEREGSVTAIPSEPDPPRNWLSRLLTRTAGTRA